MRSLAPAIPQLPPRIGYGQGDVAGRDRYRSTTEPWRAWYTSRRWRSLRWSVLVDACFTCNSCQRVVVPSSQAVCDHKVPHRGDARLFWDRFNLQCLCKPCHDSVKQREDRIRGTGGWVNRSNRPLSANPPEAHAQNFSCHE
jgi:5-methylcytosine-specific restriction endonuclease McrA